MKLRVRPADTCRRLQHTLADQGPTALRDDQAGQRHLEECSECFAMLEALAALDAGFEAMPRMDAPDALVESLLERDELRAEIEMPPARRSWVEAAAVGLKKIFGPGRPRLKAAMAFAILAVIGLPAYLQFQLHRVGALSEGASVAAPRSNDQPSVNVVHKVSRNPAEGRRDQKASREPVEKARKQLKAIGYLEGGADEIEDVIMPVPPPPEPEPLVTEELRVYSEAPRIESPQSAFTSSYSSDNQFVIDGVASDPQPAGPVPNQAGGKDAKNDAALMLLEVGGDDDLPVWVGTSADMTFRGGSPRIESDASGLFDEDDEARALVRERLRERLRSLPRKKADVGKSTQAEPITEGNENLDSQAEQGAFLKLDERRASLSEKPLAGDTERALARRFLAERDAVAIAGQPATGYWTNTYVPGDPVMRYLQARLAGSDLEPASSDGDAPSRLHDGAQRTTQPFDPPPDAALTVQLQSDRSAIEGETRMLVQVGLVGTPRLGGRRPAMNVAVVLDLDAEIPDDVGSSLVALAGAFAEASDLGDRFRLLAAGRGGGEVVAPGDFRRGPVVVATSGLLARGGPAPGASLDLVEVVRMAIARVARDDDPTAPLGSSAIILATSRPLGADVEALAALAHESAVAGIPLSVVGVGDAVELTELDRLALAGQGSRRLLREPSGAPGLVDRELAAAGRAVARAVRLRIDLAPGVRLVDIVGARRHDQAGAERVRNAERAIDLRAARNLGIEADRGDDEAGVQIVIPTFYAGDHHVVLLDVVASGPGPIADVTVRFKDLVQLENSVARARLDLARGDGVRGPLERNVLKNLLAHRLRDVLERAGRDLATPRADGAAGGRVAALKQLEAHRQLLAGLGVELAGFDRDPDVSRDIAMLEEYAQLLSGPWIDTPERRRYVADSMRYAARLKVLPAPVPVGGAR